MASSIDTTDPVRKRRAHTKSRRGCANCKLRRVKCDETKPSCDKCKAYGVSCDYDGGAPTELHHAGEGAFPVEPSVADCRPSMPNVQDLPPMSEQQLPPSPPSEIILSMLDQPLALYDSDEVYRINEDDIELLHKFQDRTVFSIGTAQTVHIYRESIPMLATVSCSTGYLTHVILTLVLMHDRTLSDDPWQPPSTKETFHHYHGTATFNRMLSGPVEHSEKDAMWAAAALLGCITIASVDATHPAECWPLKEDSETDLQWLRMSDGKKAVWKIANPLREDSIWKAAMDYQWEKDPVTRCIRPELEGMQPAIRKLFDFDESKEGTGDPYHTATSIVLRLIPIECTHSTVLYFLSFIGHMDPAFRELLYQKDPKAMLLLAWWYAKMADYPAWWLQRRAQMECKSICIYLQRRFTPYSEIGKLLDYPKSAFGLAVSGEYARKVDQARSRSQASQLNCVMMI